MFKCIRMVQGHFFWSLEELHKIDKHSIYNNEMILNVSSQERVHIISLSYISYLSSFVNSCAFYKIGSRDEGDPNHVQNNYGDMLLLVKINMKN